jgi:ABC-2 type transport system permease protein
MSTAGTMLLLRQDLRRDRVVVPAWLSVLFLMTFASASATRTLFSSLRDRETLATMLNDQPGLVALYGPILDPSSAGELAMSKLTVLYALFSAILYVVLVRRHTRVEEESGRAELVGGTAIGRDAPLTAAIVECALVATTLGLLVTLANVAGGLPIAGSLWFGATWVGTGLVATGTAAVACQLSASARTCAAIAAGLLAGAFAVRAVGDTVGGLHWLSWLSPLGWNTQLRAWSDPRWWVAVLYVAVAAGLTVLARVLATRRDLGGGLIGSRPGPASGWMAGPWSLTFRLQRTSLVIWTAGVAGMSLLFGAMAPGLDDLLVTGGGRELIDRLGGAFMAALLPITAMTVSVLPISVIARAHHDEEAGRTGLAMASGATRSRWFVATAASAALVAAWLLLVAGSLLWVGYRAAGGSLTVSLVGAAVGWAPAVWTVTALALLGLAARLAWVGWAALVLFVTLTLVGELLELPSPLVRLSPYSAIHAYPVVDWSWTSPAVLTVSALALSGAAAWLFGRRDLG